ncbi:hypothetical protein P775_14665 [Puniceibacterium antarcticum]|uniref:Transport-associated OB type 2 domain-containing protein n=1 Tax=Puniceibacterium antarcticum TaxID=1206336 RepID=A0A2G8RD80_9RHOB|nr:TOBE domain-containing protein [Puniceibacterium antarcticum]PIL19381.1 hypothetical protein P775_14665 [Puniceibacterium antarcticum]
MGIGPEHIKLAASGEGHLERVAEYLGADTFVTIAYEGAFQVTVLLIGNTDLKPDETVGLHFTPENLRFFDDAGLAV